MSMNIATPRDLVVAGLVSIVGQGVAVMAPSVGAALETVKAVVAHNMQQTADGAKLADTDPGLDWAKKCVAAYRKSVEVASESRASGNSPDDTPLPKECITPVAGDRSPTVMADELGGIGAGAEAERSASAHSMWNGQLDYSVSAVSSAVATAPGRRCIGVDITSGVCDESAGAARPGSDQAGVPTRAFQDARLAIAPSELDNMRGGFETDGGFKFSFGIERAVYINGQLVTTQTLNSSDLRGGAAGQAVANMAAAQTLSVIQNGPGNTFVPGSVATNGTVIQNTLNGQTIQNRTVINASVNSMQALRSLNLQTAVRDGIVSSLRR